MDGFQVRNVLFEGVSDAKMLVSGKVPWTQNDPYCNNKGLIVVYFFPRGSLEKWRDVWKVSTVGDTPILYFHDYGWKGVNHQVSFDKAGY